MPYYKKGKINDRSYDDTKIWNDINLIDEKKTKVEKEVIYTDVEGANVSADSVESYAKDIEILGNTIQDASNLADIRSVGDKVEGQELYKIDVVSCGKNLFDGLWESGTIDQNTGSLNPDLNMIRSLNYIEVLPNTNYIASSSILTKGVIWHSYDENYNFIEGVTNKGLTYYTTPNNAKYIKVRTFLADNNVISLTCPLQIEEGTVATPYEPYQEEVTTILSPVQLEKVADVADRIICKDGVWGVEKNIKTIILNGSDSENWVDYIDKSNDTYSSFACNGLIDMQPNHHPLCDKFPGLYITGDKEAISRGQNNLEVTILNSKLSIATLNGFKAWMQNNPILVKYKLVTSQFIPLPHDQQVKLRTFASKTNISFLTEIEGTIKASIPKSLGATVNTHTEQIANLNKELDRVKKLEESTVSTVTTESDFTTVEETSNGYFEDVKLEGKTLVNLLNNTYFSYSNNIYCKEEVELNSSVSDYNVANGRIKLIALKKPMEINKTYSLLVNVTEFKNIRRVAFYLQSDGNMMQYISLCTTSGFAKVDFICKYNNIDRIGIYVDQDSENVGYAKIKEPMILESSLISENPPSYFEGLKSVGDGVDEVSVESVNGDGNLFGFESKKFSCNTTSNWYDVQGAPNMYFNMTNKTKCKVYLPAGTYTFGYDGINSTNVGILQLVSIDEKFFVNVDNAPNFQKTYYLNEGIYTIRARGASVGDVFIKDAQILKGDTPKPYTPYQSNKKPLLYYNPTSQQWEKPILRQWDSIEKHSDGKYYYHKRSEEVVLNGSENWELRDTRANTFSFKLANILNISDVNINDKFIVNDKVNADEESLNTLLSYTEIIVSILKSKLSTQDVAGFKQWLQANNVTVVYQLAQEEVYECTNIDLITYANETNYIVSSGVIVPKTTLKVQNNIANVILLLQKEVSLLESESDKIFKDILSGDYHSLAYGLYPEDFDTED